MLLLVVVVLFLVVFHHLQPAGPTPNPASGHIIYPLTNVYMSRTCLMFSSNEGQPSLVHVDFYSFQSNLSTHLYSIKYKFSTSAQHTLTTSKYGGLIDSVLRNTLSCSGRDLNPRPLRYRLSRLPIQRIDSLYRSNFYGYHFRDPHAVPNSSMYELKSPIHTTNILLLVMQRPQIVHV